MKEIRTLIFTAISSNTSYKTFVGGSSLDPRFYWTHTPQKVLIDDNKRGYAVFYRSGIIRPGLKVETAQKDDQIYTVEIYGKTPDLVDDISDVIVEIFREKEWTTTNYRVLYSYAAGIGTPYYDDNRKLFTGSLNVYFTKIISI